MQTAASGASTNFKLKQQLYHVLLPVESRRPAGGVGVAVLVLRSWCCGVGVAVSVVRR
jgi:hypothetical protein